MNNNIAILTTVINQELYQKSSIFFPKNIQKYVIDGSNGMHGLHSILYMMKKLKGRGIEWLIMADEDVLFENSNMIFDIIQRMEFENYSVCGIRDGGLITHRNYNPHLINTFFSIINLKEIESIWDSKQMLKNNYIVKNEFNDDLAKLSLSFNSESVYEPYYCFYLWLRRNKKYFLFLDANQPFSDDKITNAVYYNDKILLYHTWYARSYGINDNHTVRINNILDLLQFEKNETTIPIVFKDKTFFFKQRISKLFNRIDMKIRKISNCQE